MQPDLVYLKTELALKKKPIPFPIRNIEEIKHLRDKYPCSRSKFLFTWLYLTGQRISEALDIKRSDCWVGEQEGQEVLLIDSKTLKNPSHPRRTIPIPLEGKESSMSSFLWKTIENYEPESYIFGNMSRQSCYYYIGKVRIQTTAVDPHTKDTMAMDLKIYPHFLRHCRASIIASEYGYDIYQLMQFFGWKTPNVATVYAKMNWQSLVKPLLKG